jgi:pseudaminic acid biosynthesis-associated methylase
MSTINVWQGQFGDEYTDRNVVDSQKRVPAFREMFRDLDLGYVIEIGCNRGHNLQAVRTVLPDAIITGIEPNQKALHEAKKVGHAMYGKGDNLPFGNGTYDLAFTAGVLIHIPPAELDDVLTEVMRVTRRYILAIEYAADEDTAITYRGNEGLLWKRDFYGHYKRLNPQITLVRSGYWKAEDGFDDCTWWLMEKPGRIVGNKSQSLRLE